MTVITNTNVQAPGIAPVLSPSEADRMVRAGQAFIVDVREADECRREAVAGTLPCPSSTFWPGAFPAPRDGMRALVLCRSGGRAGRVASAMRAAGRNDVLTIEGGILAWQAAGLPVQKNARAPLPMFRQVMLTVGVLLLVLTVLAATVSEWFLIGTGFLGAGLVFAGATGHCALAALLGAMPWNRLPTGAPESGAPGAAKSSDCCGGGSCAP